MRTVGRRLPPGHTSGEFNAYCDKCGVLWPRSRLREDSKGQLVCPDEGDGLDEVALAEADARALERAARWSGRPKQSGRPQEPDSEFYASPVSIAGPANTLGWWLPEAGLSAASGRAQWRSSAPATRKGALSASAGASPAVSLEDGVTFVSGVDTPLRWVSEEWRVTGDDLAIWVVATLDDEVAIGQALFQLGAIDESGSLVFGVALGRIGSSGAAYAQVRRSAGGSPLSVISDAVDNSAHMFKLSLAGQDQAVMVDDATYTTTHSGTGFDKALVNGLVGLRGSGVIHEMAVTEGAGDVDSDMKKYFRRRWSGLPDLGTETTEAGSTL